MSFDSQTWTLSATSSGWDSNTVSSGAPTKQRHDAAGRIRREKLYGRADLGNDKISSAVVVNYEWHKFIGVL